MARPGQAWPGLLSPLTGVWNTSAADVVDEGFEADAAAMAPGLKVVIPPRVFSDD